MLTVIGKKHCGRVDVELGDYVPLKFRCETESPDPHLYWRTGDLKSTLLEVEICPTDGQIIGASLLLTGNVSKGFPALKLPDWSSVGFPLVCIDDWPDNRFMDEPKPFQIFVEASRLLILLSSVIAIKSIALNNVTFGVCANGSVAWIVVSDLNPERLAGLTG